ncbi:hypothetical protein L3X38_013107 [Prunus dulcis]|uniref:Uncharacterized protein n=1 Tax=Prunus dulcis TaxID=3755 RepID=A0AAD4WKL5_PRUDU|nr:hypothetical protein L3X38_013107 [Prunus dulcis]
MPTNIPSALIDKGQSRVIDVPSAKDVKYPSCSMMPFSGLRFEIGIRGVFKEQRVTDITLLELLSYGPQKEAGKCQPVKTFSGNFIVHHWTRNGVSVVLIITTLFPQTSPLLGPTMAILRPHVSS